jgi:metal-responsive CopG/Arc/MetJ family transcriptional regulator
MQLDVPMRCDKLIQLRAPETLAKALDSAADRRLISRSDYIRGALLDRLRADEIALASQFKTQND